MDKNTILGFVLIALIVLGFSQLNKKSDKEIADEKRYSDSIAFVEQNKVEIAANVSKQAVLKDSVAVNDTTSKATTADAFGDFSVAAQGV